MEDVKKTPQGQISTLQQVRQTLTKKLKQRRKGKKCHMLNRLDSQLELNVGKYRHGEDEGDEFVHGENSESTHPSEVHSVAEGASDRSGRPGTVNEEREIEMT